MKSLKRYLLLPFLFLFAAFTPLIGGTSAKAADAAAVPTHPRYVGNIMLVNGTGTYFKDGEADCAVYFFNSKSDNAWSDKCSYRIYGDFIRVVVPGASSKTWGQFIVCRYNPSMNPATDGWNGVYNQTADIYTSSFLYNQNTVNITGYNDDSTLKYSLYANDYTGIKGEEHMYLDLSGFTDWEDGNAKFAIYFANPDNGNGVDWSLKNSSEGYGLSFCWKVQGQDNEHLYECIVPGINRVWNMVIAARFNPVQEVPGWYDCTWDQTGNLQFNLSNNNANMIHINGWNSGYIDSENIISKESRVGFYGDYFLDTVQCSGSGDSDATTSTMWNAAKDEYVNHLSTPFQGEVYISTGDKDGTTIQKAMARYDYIVFYKQYSHEDFIGREDSPGKTNYSTLVHPIDNNIDQQQKVWPIAIVALAVAMGGLSSLLIIKIRKNKR